ncbi:hypothetical protein BGZ63DRAFT_404862 [Mariannaea sp. PMI_226]|nr:hypothetical protein BGZ63DRAFT_404862 [Mariannaea sp. PMI_226]
MSPEKQELNPVQQQDKEDAESSGVEYDSDLDYSQEEINWKDVVRIIQETTKEAFPASPKGNDFSEQAFQTYWHGVFSQLAKSIESDNSIPQFLTTPPVEEFTAQLFAKGNDDCTLGCPCGLPRIPAAIKLENSDGVTKVDLIKAFTECMYGEKLPKIYSPAPFEEGQQPDMKFTEAPDRAWSKIAPSLVYHSDWLIGSEKSKPGVDVIVGEVPNIFVYCCGPDNFLKKVEELSKKNATQRK